MKKKVLVLLMAALVFAFIAVGCSEAKQNQTAPSIEYEWLSETSVRITAVSGAEYSIDDGQTWQDSNVFTGLDSEGQYVLSIRMKETDTHNASPKASVTAVRGGLTQTALSFVFVAAKTYGDAPFQLSTTGGSGTGAVTYTLVSGPATVTATGLVTITGAGTVVIKAEKAGDSNYEAVQATVAVTVNQSSQSNFNIKEIETKTYGDAPFQLSTTGGSGTGAVTYTLVSGPATVTSTGLVTITGIGTIVVKAEKTGDSNYKAAEATVTITVNQAAQSNFYINEIENKTYGDAPFQLSTTGGSGMGAVTYTLVSGPATVTSTGLVTITGAGTVVIKAEIAGDHNYKATEATMIMNVNKAKQSVLSIFPVGSKNDGSAPFQLLTTGGNGTGTVTYSLVSGPATITSTGLVTINGTGTIVVIATKAADGNYNNISSAAYSIVVASSILPQTPISINSVPTKYFGDTAFQLSTTGGSGTGDVIFSLVTGNAVSVSNSGLVTILRTGTVTISVTKSGDSNYTSATSTLTMTIGKGYATVGTAAEFISAAGNNNYATVTLSTDIDLNNSAATVAAGVIVYAGNFNIAGIGALANNGRIISEVSSREAFVLAIEFANLIKLTADISDKVSGTYTALSISSALRSYEFDIDLNGFAILPRLDFRNNISGGYSEYGLVVTVYDSSTGKTGTIGNLDNTGSLHYGIMINGDNHIAITLSGVTALGYYGGLYTNGTCEGATLTATNCTFNANSAQMGAYLAGNLTYYFTNCTFGGGAGVLMKSGTVVLDNCTITATIAYVAPKYNGNGGNASGSALLLESSQGYKKTLNVTIIGGAYTSAYGYAIEQVSTYASANPTQEVINETNYAEIYISGNVTFSSGKKDRDGKTVAVTSVNRKAEWEVSGNAALVQALKSQGIKKLTIAAGSYEIDALHVYEEHDVLGIGSVTITVNGTVSSQASIIFQNTITLKNLTIIGVPSDADGKTHSAVKITKIQGGRIDKAILTDVSIEGANLNMHGVDDGILTNVTIAISASRGCVALSIAESNVTIIESDIGNGTWGSIGVMYGSTYVKGFTLTLDADTQVSSAVYLEKFAESENVADIQGNYIQTTIGETKIWTRWSGSSPAAIKDDLVADITASSNALFALYNAFTEGTEAQHDAFYTPLMYINVAVNSLIINGNDYSANAEIRISMGNNKFAEIAPYKVIDSVLYISTVIINVEALGGTFTLELNQVDYDITVVGSPAVLSIKNVKGNTALTTASIIGNEITYESSSNTGILVITFADAHGFDASTLFFTKKVIDGVVSYGMTGLDKNGTEFWYYVFGWQAVAANETRVVEYTIAASGVGNTHLMINGTYTHPAP